MNCTIQVTTPRREDVTVLCAGADLHRDRPLGMDLEVFLEGTLTGSKACLNKSSAHSWLCGPDRLPVVQAWDSEPMRSGEGQRCDRPES